MDIRMVKQEVVFDTVVTTFDMKFENRGFVDYMANIENLKIASFPLKARNLFDMFPFSITFNHELKVVSLGSALIQIIPKVVGQNLKTFFELVKPLVELKWEVLLSRINSTFELATLEEIDELGKTQGSTSYGGYSTEINILEDEDIDKTLHLKGTILHIAEWQMMVFLGCPIMNDLNNLLYTGLFVNDLSMHDMSREKMLSKTQEQIELKMALVNAEIKSYTMKLQQDKLADVMKKTQDIIDQMLPKQISNELAAGKTNMELCQTYNMVTMLFSDIVTFTNICSRLQPLQVVALLNNMYTLFDFLCDQNAVYKVETIGDAYLIVAGCPVKSSNHALKIADMAFDMMDGISMLKDPATGADIEMRIGCHSGPVIAGVVGMKMPRYCLFGQNVGLTEKFESNSKPMRIHISDTCQQLLGARYKVEERNDAGLKEKLGGHKSYFLNSKDGRQPLSEQIIRALLPSEDETAKIEKELKRLENAPKEEVSSTEAAENGNDKDNVNGTEETAKNITIVVEDTEEETKSIISKEPPRPIEKSPKSPRRVQFEDEVQQEEENKDAEVKSTDTTIIHEDKNSLENEGDTEEEMNGDQEIVDATPCFGSAVCNLL